MYFFIEDDDLLKKYNTIWGNISDLSWSSEPAYNKEFLKTKIKSHGDEVTDFYGKSVSKVDSNHTCLVVIALGSALKKDNNYHPQVLLNECKYIEQKLVRHIHHNFSDFSYSSDESKEE